MLFLRSPYIPMKVKQVLLYKNFRLNPIYYKSDIIHKYLASILIDTNVQFISAKQRIIKIDKNKTSNIVNSEMNLLDSLVFHQDI